VFEHIGDEILTDADRSEHNYVALSLDEAEARQLLEYAPVEGSPWRLVPAVEDHVGIEPIGVGTDENPTRSVVSRFRR
jgi:hypothetical protein